MTNLYDIIGRRVFFCFDAETAHGLSLTALKCGLASFTQAPTDQRLSQTIAGLVFPNPIGMAAGYDKNAEVPLALLKLGFGFAEIGTITPFAQPGNPKPRIFRLPSDGAVINRLGFNNEGHGPALQRLQRFASDDKIIGVNIGANKDSKDRIEDYIIGIEKFYDVARYFTANISSPNTPGLRDMQAKEALEELLRRTLYKRNELAKEKGHKVPIFLKIAPDLTEESLDDIAQVFNDNPMDGIIISNTTITRQGLIDGNIAVEAGGLSGRPVFNLSNIVLAKMRKRLGKEAPIIGVGGVDSADSALEKMRAGADLVQLYTGMIYKGPFLAGTILKGLKRYCDQEGLSNISDIRDEKLEFYAAQSI